MFEHLFEICENSTWVDRIECNMWDLENLSSRVWLNSLQKIKNDKHLIKFVANIWKISTSVSNKIRCRYMKNLSSRVLGNYMQVLRSYLINSMEKQLNAILKNYQQQCLIQFHAESWKISAVVFDKIKFRNMKNIYNSVWWR